MEDGPVQIISDLRTHFFGSLSPIETKIKGSVSNVPLLKYMSCAVRLLLDKRFNLPYIIIIIKPGLKLFVSLIDSFLVLTLSISEMNKMSQMEGAIHLQRYFSL